MSEKKIIIIGGGGAGLAAAQAARENAPQSSICLICGENRLPYYRLRICEVLSGLTAEKLTVRSQDWLQEKNIQIIMDTAQSIDSQEQSVLLANGQKLAYDTLILATGGQGN
ncbi:MAG: FAD-dependent oxidoreductase, partial [Clostridiales bacterium]